LNLAENGSNDGKRGPYKPVEKVRIKQEIYNKILQGYPYQTIMEYLRMPERTFYNYLSSIREEEKDFLKDTISKEEMKWQTQLCHDRLEASLNTLSKWVEDPQFKDRVGAMHLLNEVNAAIMRLYVYGPSYVKRYDNNNNNGGSNSSSRKEKENNNKENNKELSELKRLNKELAEEEEFYHNMGASASQWQDFLRRKKAFLEQYQAANPSPNPEEEDDNVDPFGFK
jgi:hypothetical protein